MKQYLFVLLALVALAGCVPEQGTPEKGGTSDPPTNATLEDYAKTWKVVIDGEFYATVIFDSAGQMISNTDTSFLSGNVIATSPDGSTCRVTELVQPPAGSAFDHFTVTFNGAMSADHKAIYGRYTKNVGTAILDGKWCATALGNPYLTNSSMEGEWDMTAETRAHSLMFDTTGHVVSSNNASFIPGSGTVEFTGGLGVVIRAQFVHTYPLGSTATVHDFYIGELDATKTSATGSFTTNIGTATLQGPWTAALIPANNG